MYCKFCGKEIETDIKFCPHCGKNIVDAQNNGFAITGLILGIISSVFYGLAIFQILAIIFSIIALVKIKHKKASGKKMAIVGLVLGILYTGQFAIKIPSQMDYYENLYNQAFLSHETNIMENEEFDELLGTWQAINNTGELTTSMTLVLNRDSFVLTNNVVYGKIVGFSEFSGKAEILEDTVILYLTEYSKESTMDVDALLGTTRILKIKDNKLYDNVIEFNRIR